MHLLRLRRYDELIVDHRHERLTWGAKDGVRPSAEGAKIIIGLTHSHTLIDTFGGGLS